MPSPLASLWGLDPGITFLNHGSFGATPLSVLEAQAALRTRLESEPVRFFQRELEGLLDGALSAIGSFVGAQAKDLAGVANATSGVNAVVRSLLLEEGDELLVTDHAYNACRNTLDWVAARSGARVVVVSIPFESCDDDSIVASIVSVATPRTRLALIDHVTSPTAVVLPVARLVSELAALGIDTLVDGAHAPGMVPVDLTSIGAAYYAANCHKWMCAPKGAGFLHVRADRQDGLVPPVVSHGLNSDRSDRSRFRLLFDWTGTDDPTALLAVPAAIDAVAAMKPGGWDVVQVANRDLALAGAGLIAEAVPGAGSPPPALVGSMVAMTLPIPAAPGYAPHPLHDRLFADHDIEVPVYSWGGATVLRISAHLYNAIDDYERLAAAVGNELATTAARTA